LSNGHHPAGGGAGCTALSAGHRGLLHLYIGQEAVSTGSISARRPEDRAITAYRDHGAAINSGIPAKEVMAELLGKVTDLER
jgi:pyruvate dehydrogenase E1 component alpha subunit